MGQTSAPPARISISASAIGEFVYCARSHALRRAAANADDPDVAIRHAQGRPKGWRPAATAQFARRERERVVALADGVQAHHQVDGRVRLAGALSLAGGLLIVAALALTILPSIITLAAR